MIVIIFNALTVDLFSKAEVGYVFVFVEVVVGAGQAVEI